MFEDDRELPCTGDSLHEGGNQLVFDLNVDGQVNLTDPLLLLEYLFQGGKPSLLGTECIEITGCPDVCVP